MAFAQILGGAAAVAGVASSFSASKSAKKLNKKALRIQEGTLEFARQKFKLFEPIIKSTTKFFGSVPLDEIVSGRVLSADTRARLERLGQIETNISQEQEADLKRRGVDSSLGGLALRNQLKLGLRSARAQVINDGIQRDINQRLNLTSVGLGQANQVINASGNLSNLLSQQANQQSQIGGQGALAAGQGLAEVIGAQNKPPAPQVQSLNQIIPNQAGPSTFDPSAFDFPKQSLSTFRG